MTLLIFLFEYMVSLGKLAVPEGHFDMSAGKLFATRTTVGCM